MKKKVMAASQSIFIPLDNMNINAVKETVNKKIKTSIEDQFGNILTAFDNTGELTDEGKLDYKSELNYDYIPVEDTKTKLNLDLKSFYFPSKKAVAEFGKLNNKDVELIVASNSNKVISDFEKEFDFEFKEITDPYTEEKVTGMFIDSLKPYLHEMDPSKPKGTTVFPKNINMKDTGNLGDKILSNIILGPEKFHIKFMHMLLDPEKSSPEFVKESIQIIEKYKKDNTKYPALVARIELFLEKGRGSKEHLRLYKELMSSQPEDYETDYEDKSINSPLIFRLLNNDEIASIVAPLDPSSVASIKKILVEKLKAAFDYEKKAAEVKELQKEVNKIIKDKKALIKENESDDTNKTQLLNKLNYAVKEIHDKWAGKRIPDEDYKKLVDLQKQYKKDKEAAGKKGTKIIELDLLREDVASFSEEINKINSVKDYMYHNYKASTTQILLESLKGSGDKSDKVIEKLKTTGFKIIQNNLREVLELLLKPIKLQDKNEKYGLHTKDPITINLKNKVEDIFLTLYKENQKQAKEDKVPTDFLNLRPYMPKGERDNPSHISVDKETLKEFIESPTYTNYVNSGGVDLDLPDFKTGGKGSVSPLAEKLSESDLIKKQVYKEKTWAKKRFFGGGSGYYIATPGSEKGEKELKNDQQTIDALASTIVYIMEKQLKDPSYNRKITDAVLKYSLVTRSSTDYIKTMTQFIKKETDVKGVAAYPANIIMDQLDALLTVGWDAGSITKLLKPIEKELVDILKEGNTENFSIRDLMVDTEEAREDLTKELKKELEGYKDTMSKRASKNIRKKLIQLFGLKINDKGKGTWSKSVDKKLEDITDSIMHNNNTSIFHENFRKGTTVLKMLEGLPGDVLETLLVEPDLQRMVSLLTVLGSGKGSKLKDLTQLLFKKGVNRETTMDILRKGSPDKARKFFSQRADTLKDIYTNKNDKNLKDEKKLIVASRILGEMTKDKLDKKYNPAASLKYLNKQITKLEEKLKLYEGAKLLQVAMQKQQKYYTDLGSKNKTDYFKKTQEVLKNLEEEIANHIKNITVKADTELVKKLSELKRELKDKDTSDEVINDIKLKIQKYKIEEGLLDKKAARLGSIFKNLNKGKFPKTLIDDADKKAGKASDRWLRLQKQIKNVEELINLKEGFSKDGTVKKPSMHNPDYTNLDDFLKDLDFNTVIDVLDSSSIKDSVGRYSLEIGKIASNLLMQEVFLKDGNDKYKEDFLKTLSDYKSKGYLNYDMELFLNAVAGEVLKDIEISKSDFQSIKSDAI